MEHNPVLQRLVQMHYRLPDHTTQMC